MMENMNRSLLELLIISMYLSNRSATGIVWHSQFIRRNKAGFNSEFSFLLSECLIKIKEPNLPYNLPLNRKKQMNSCFF